MDDDTMRAVAAQLKNPTSAMGGEVAKAMVDSNAAITERALQVLDAQPGETIVELGPASGRLSIPMVATLGAGGHYIGIELSELMAQTATAVLDGLPAKVEILQRDCMEVDLPAHTVDGVMSVNVTYFVDDLPALFERIHGWLKPRGRIVVGVRSAISMAQLPFTAYGFHVVALDQLMADLSHAGFVEITAIYHDEGIVEALGIEVELDSIIVVGRRAERTVI